MNQSNGSIDKPKMDPPQVGQKPALRPSLELIRQFSSLIQEGLPFDGACDYLGILPGTFWSWIRKGELYNSDPETDQKNKVYGDFVMELRRAAAAYRLTLIRRMHKEPGWARELEILSRRDRKNFSRFDMNLGTQGIETLDPDSKYV